MAKATWQCPGEWSEWSEWLAAGLHARNRWRLPVLLVGILFAHGRRTVTTWLRAAGVSDDYQDYYYFLAALGGKTKSVATQLLLLVLRTLPLPERLLVVIESGMGFAFLALIIGYLPALNQSFARREVSISLLDARAGSPPTASEMLRRHGHERGKEALRQLLHEWERWSAEFLEGHLSYPVLAYFRSQHDNQSWLAALTAILDTCALIMAGVEGACERQAELTFAMARHAVIDLSLVFRTAPRKPTHDRLPPEKLAELRLYLAVNGQKLRDGDAADLKLQELRLLYEPNINALATYFQVTLPPWIAEEGWVDNWQGSFWERPDKREKSAGKGKADHF